MDNSINLESFHLVSIGITDPDEGGEFLDYLMHDFYINVVGDICIVYNDQVGTVVTKGLSLNDSLKKALSGFKCEEFNALPDGFVSALIISTFEKNADELINFNEDFGEKWFEASECDDVEEYGSCIFGKGSETYGLNNISFDMISHNVTHDGDILDNISEIYGRVDEGNSWVIAVPNE